MSIVGYIVRVTAGNQSVTYVRQGSGYTNLDGRRGQAFRFERQGAILAARELNVQLPESTAEVLAVPSGRVVWPTA